MPADNFEKIRPGNTKPVVAFVGAGASAGLYPLWPVLVEQLGLYGRRGFPGYKSSDKDTKWDQLAAFWSKFKSVEPAHVVEQIKENFPKKWSEVPGSSLPQNKKGKHKEDEDDLISPTAYDSLLADIFSDRQDEYGRRFSPVHERIVSIPNLRGLITLNYDDGLRHALCHTKVKKLQDINVYDLSGPVGSNLKWDFGESLKIWLDKVENSQPDGPPPILHLHGHYSKSAAAVLDFSQYRRVYDDEQRLRLLLVEVLRDFRVIFIGFGFTDAALCTVLSSVAANFLRRGKTSHTGAVAFELPDRANTGTLLDPCDEYKKALKKLYEDKYGVTACFYNVRKSEKMALGEKGIPPFNGHSNVHDQLDAFLDSHDAPQPHKPAKVDDLWYGKGRGTDDEKSSYYWRSQLISGLFATPSNESHVHLVVRSDLRMEKKPPSDQEFIQAVTELGKQRLQIIKDTWLQLGKLHPTGSNERGSDISETSICDLYDCNNISVRFKQKTAFNAYKSIKDLAERAVAEYDLDYIKAGGEGGIYSLPMEYGSWQLVDQDAVDIEIAINPAQPFTNPNPGNENKFSVRLVPTISSNSADLSDSDKLELKRIIAKAVFGESCTSSEVGFIDVEILESYDALRISDKHGMEDNSGPVHLAYVGPMAYARLAASGTVNPLARGGDSSAGYYSIAVGRRAQNGKEQYQTLSQIIRDRSRKSQIEFWFSDRFSTSGFLVPFVELMSRGLRFGKPDDQNGSMPVYYEFEKPKGDSAQQIGTAYFGKSHFDVLNKLTGNPTSNANIIAFVDSDMLGEWRKQSPNETIDLKMLWISDKRLPPYPWVANRKLVNLPLAHSITQCLVGEGAKENEMRELLQRNQIISRLFGGSDCFSRIGVTGIYDPVRDLLTKALVFAHSAGMANEDFAKKLMPDPKWLPKRNKTNA